MYPSSGNYIDPYRPYQARMDLPPQPINPQRAERVKIQPPQSASYTQQYPQSVPVQDRQYAQQTMQNFPRVDRAYGASPAPAPATISVIYYDPSDPNCPIPAPPRPPPAPVALPVQAPQMSYVDMPSNGGYQFFPGDTYKVVAVHENKLESTPRTYDYGGYTSRPVPRMPRGTMEHRHPGYGYGSQY